MVTRTKDQNTYVHGDWNAVCDVCGFKFKASDLRKRWDGYMVCADDWEKRHESDFFRAPKEDQSVDWTRLDSTPEQSTFTDVDGNSVTTDTGPEIYTTAFGIKQVYYGAQHPIFIIKVPNAGGAQTLRLCTGNNNPTFIEKQPRLIEGLQTIIYRDYTIGSGESFIIAEYSNGQNNIYTESTEGSPPTKYTLTYRGDASDYLNSGWVLTDTTVY